MTMVCPGYISTQLSVNALTGDGSKHGGMEVLEFEYGPTLGGLCPVTDTTTAKGMSAEFAAQQITQCIAAKGRSLVLATPIHHLALYLSFLWPSLLDWILQKRARIT